MEKLAGGRLSLGGYMVRRNWKSVLSIGITSLLTSAGIPRVAVAQMRVSIGVTETMETYNPYGDSVALLYDLYSEVTGPFCSYNFATGEYEGRLAQRWEIKDPNTWVFYLDKRYIFNDGSPVTSADVVHSMGRVLAPDSKHTTLASPMLKAEAVDKYTVKLITKNPTAPLLDFICDRFIITSKAAYEKYGAADADRNHMLGGGPYARKEMVPGQRIVLVKRPDHHEARKNPQAPDEIVFRTMREPEQRVTALLNNEIQIAQFIPPHLRKRVEASPHHKVVGVDSLELMFLAMQPKPPFDKKEVRQAVCYAIDRDKIIATLLEGFAARLDGPIGPGQYGYDPNLQPRYGYNPEKAKQLLSQAGYPNGVDVELQTPVGRYTLDKQITEAMVPMLNAVGIRTKLLTPEWATLWANVQVGKVPFYYMGRGGVVDPSAALSQYFETGGSPRIGYSNPKADELLAAERQAFNPEKRKQLLSQAMSLITEEAPAHFLWRHQLLFGMAKNVDYRPLPSERIYAWNMKVNR